MDEVARAVGALEARMGNVETAVGRIDKHVEVLMADRVAQNAMRIWAARLIPFAALGVSIAALLIRG